MNDFRIIIDSREQEPWSFTYATLRRALPAGDYSVDGLEGAVAVERKSLADFTRTVLHEFPRFAAELDQLAQLPHACIVVEADLDHVLRGQAADVLRGASPESLLGAAVHIQARFHVPVLWCGSRQAARAFTDAYLRMVARETAARAQGEGPDA
ncbi:MAG: ERCC4 domain-containing protein [Phycisphaerae bacterium]|nr:ERCC4 domain-containing protein [Phycisphaerae bacterium]